MRGSRTTPVASLASAMVAPVASLCAVFALATVAVLRGPDVPESFPRILPVSMAITLSGELGHALSSGLFALSACLMFWTNVFATPMWQLFSLNRRELRSTVDTVQLLGFASPIFLFLLAAIPLERNDVFNILSERSASARRHELVLSTQSRLHLISAGLFFVSALLHCVYSWRIFWQIRLDQGGAQGRAISKAFAVTKSSIFLKSAALALIALVLVSAFLLHPAVRLVPSGFRACFESVAENFSKEQRPRPLQLVRSCQHGWSSAFEVPVSDSHDGNLIGALTQFSVIGCLLLYFSSYVFELRQIVHEVKFQL